MNKIIGLERKQGEFTNDNGNKINYDNTLVYFVTDTNVNVLGMKGSYLKVKTSELAKMLGCDVKDVGIAVNRKADFHFDLSVTPPTLCGITLITDEPKK